jgi:probable F420-dependent oxidoreductase
MKIGVATYATSYSIRPEKLAAEVEQRGFESLFYAEHSHIPVSRETARPSGADVPRDYFSSWDPFVAVSFACAATSTLNVGTGACLATQRDPIQLAHVSATLDVASNGRFLFGVAAGWNAEEMRNHGTDASVRFGVLQDRMLAVREIWTKDEPEYHGRHVDFDPIWCWPKPRTPSGPPILVCGNGPRIVERVARFGDEWMPRVDRVGDALESMIQEMNQLAEQASRSQPLVSAYGVRAEADAIKALADIGVHRVVLYLPSVDTEATLPILDEHAKVIGA